MTPEEQMKFSQRHIRFSSPSQSLLGKVLTFVLGAVFLVLAFMFSVVALAVVAVGGLALGGWIWWKTRALRQQLREQMAQDPGRESMSEAQRPPAGRQGDIIEGEVIREPDSSNRPRSEDPAAPRPLR